jgi:hypothetical protein
MTVNIPSIIISHGIKDIKFPFHSYEGQYVERELSRLITRNSKLCHFMKNLT